MTRRASDLSRTNSAVLGAALVLALACGLAAPAGAAEVKEAGTKKAANWTVFLATGSKMAATEVHHDEEAGRYAIVLPNGGRITLSETAVRRVSRDTEDRVEKTAPVVAAAPGAPRPGPAPGSLDTTGLTPEPLRTDAIKPEGESLKTQAESRQRALGNLQGDNRLQSARERQLTPRPGRMEQMLRRANSRPVAPAKR